MRGFLVGLGLGTLVGVAYAPRPGRETRRQLEAKTRQSLDNANERVCAIRERASNARSRIASAAQELKRGVMSFRQERGETTTRSTEPSSGSRRQNVAGRNNPNIQRESHRGTDRTSGADQDISSNLQPNTEMALGGDAAGQASAPPPSRPPTFLEVINEWPEEQLIAIRGIGPALAAKIIKNRPYEKDSDLIDSKELPPSAIAALRKAS